MATRKPDPAPRPLAPEEDADAIMGELPRPASPLAALADQVEQETSQALADATDADVGGIPAEAPAPAIPNAQVFAQLVGAVRDTVCMVAGLEAPKRTLTDDKVTKLGEIWGGVFDHYGIRLSDKMGTYGPIVAAALATIPLVADTVLETRKEIAQKDGRQPALAAPPAAPGAAPAPAPAAIDKGYTEGVVQPRWTP